MDEFLNSQFIVNFQDIIVPAIFSTLRMLFFSMLFGMIIGMVVAILLVMTSPYGLNPKPKLYKFVSFWVNMIRSFPVIILIVAMSPLTRVIVGTSVGEQAAIVPLTIAAFPVIARYVEASLLEVDRNVILAARSFGATNMQILIKVMFVEADAIYSFRDDYYSNIILGQHGFGRSGRSRRTRRCGFDLRISKI